MLFFVVVELKVLCFYVLGNLCRNIELDSLPLPSLCDILIIVAFPTLPKHAWSLLCRRIDMCFVGKEDIPPKIVYSLVLILFTVRYPLILILL